MKRVLCGWSLFFYFAVLCASFSHATPIVFDKPLNPAGYGFTSMYGGQNMLEDFTLSAKTQITGIGWYGLFSSGTAATSQSAAGFDVLFFSNNDQAQQTTSGGITVSGLPRYRPFYETTVAKVYGTGTAFGDPLHGGTIFRWETDIPAVLLDSGKYWVDIRSSSIETDFFLWSHSANEDGYAVRKSLPASYIPPYDPKIPFWIVADEIYDEQAFTLYGTPVSNPGRSIPEPDSVILFGLGLVGLAGYGRRAFKNQLIQPDNLL